MANYKGTVDEFRAERDQLSDEELQGYVEDERTGISRGAEVELRQRRESSAAHVAFTAHMDQDGTVVVDELEFDDPDFLERAAVALTEAAAKAHSRHASAIALAS